MNNILRKIKNKEIDGRWFLGGSHLTLVLICFLFFNLQRTVFQAFFGYTIALITEIILFKFTNKYSDSKIKDRIFSAATETAGLLVLLKSSFWWFYGFLSFITILTKYFIRRDKNKHLFNPTNFSITFALIVFPLEWFGSWPDEYMVHWYPMLHVTLFGVIAVWLANTWKICVGYILGILIFCYFFFLPTNLSELIYAIGPEFGTIGLIFLWLMITDPKTAPTKSREQFIYGVFIAFIHIILRKNQYMYSRYFAAFIVTLVFYIYEYLGLKNLLITIFNRSNVFNFRKLYKKN